VIDGVRIEGDLFIDATGRAGELINALNVGEESWREYFAADRKLIATAMPLKSIPPYAEVRATESGWTGLYPTQRLTHIVHVYSSERSTAENALAQAASNARMPLRDAIIDANEPGRRRSAWLQNCVALGEAACSFDPIHSVDLHALQLSLVHLISLFPVASHYDAERNEFNRVCQLSFERLRDFQSAYYLCSQFRSEFWHKARSTTQSQPLRHKLDTFKARGELPLYEQESFTADSWHAMLIGQGLVPESYEPGIERTAPDVVKQEFRRILKFIAEKVQEQTTHDEYLQAVCSR
jgi:tryptophan halogenase